MENEDCLLSLDERHSLWATHWERLPHCWFAFQTSGRKHERITETSQGTREHTQPHARRRHTCRNTLKNRPHHRGVGSIRTCDRTCSIPSLFFNNNNYTRRLRFWTDSIFAKMATIHKWWTSGRRHILHCRNIHQNQPICVLDANMLICRIPTCSIRHTGIRNMSTPMFATEKSVQLDNEIPAR